MTIQTVTTILTDIDQAKAQLEAAIGAARAMDAHLHVLALATGLDQVAMMGAALDPVPMSLGVEDSLERAKALGDLASAELAGEDIRWHVEQVIGSGASSGTEIARHTRFSDLVVQHRLGGSGHQDRIRRLAETVMFDAGVPLLLLPEDMQMTAPPSKILVSWDESATALRAVRQALPLLTKASYVHVVMVDPPKDAPDRSDPGGAFAQYLSRQGIKCELSVCNQTEPSIAATLERRATELGCGMIVMGAYGHSRLREAVFGGTTRSVLSEATVPVFMAH
jgi:nucleotide-binding universal stress UspA family protein